MNKRLGEGIRRQSENHRCFLQPDDTSVDLARVRRRLTPQLRLCLSPMPGQPRRSQLNRDLSNMAYGIRSGDD